MFFRFLSWVTFIQGEICFFLIWVDLLWLWFPQDFESSKGDAKRLKSGMVDAPEMRHKGSQKAVVDEYSGEEDESD